MSEIIIMSEVSRPLTSTTSTLKYFMLIEENAFEIYIKVKHLVSNIV